MCINRRRGDEKKNLMDRIDYTQPAISTADIHAEDDSRLGITSSDDRI
jgi:hypothetical protein